jgi:hypothetical protein
MNSGMRNTIAVLAAAYIASQAFDSVLRWLLNMVHAAAVIYLRDVDLIVIVFLCCYLIVREGRSVTRSVFLFSGTAVLVCVSLYSELNVAQTLFGVKVWLPVLAGFLLFEADIVPAMDWHRTWWLVWLALCCGVFLNYFVQYPWSGLNVDVGDASISANREWAAGGVRRLSGFSRTSFDAAAIILLLHIYLICLPRRIVSSLFLILLSGAAIALTTSKGAAVAFLATVVVLPLFHYARAATSSTKYLLYGGLIVLAVIGLAVPLMSEQIQFPRLQVGTPEFWLFSSFVDRAWVTWPRSFALLTEGWQWFVGRGVGGIGAAQNLFEPSVYTPGDNFFIYLYVTAGAFGAALYAYLALSVLKLSFGQVPHRAAYLLVLAVFAYGLTINLVESATFAISLGAVFAFVMSCARPEPIRSPTRSRRYTNLLHARVREQQQ